MKLANNMHYKMVSAFISFDSAVIIKNHIQAVSLFAMIKIET